MTKAYIGFGSNLGDSLAILASTIDEINAVHGLQMTRQSPLYRTQPVNTPDSQPDFINAVFEVESSLDADSLLQQLHQIEDRQGRQRDHVRNLARTLDLDLLLYGDMEMKSSTLTLPHPRIFQRAFVLFPLKDLSPDLLIPGQGQVKDLIETVRHQEVERL